MRKRHWCTHTADAERHMMGVRRTTVCTVTNQHRQKIFLSMQSFFRRFTVCLVQIRTPQPAPTAVNVYVKGGLCGASQGDPGATLGVESESLEVEHGTLLRACCATRPLPVVCCVAMWGAFSLADCVASTRLLYRHELFLPWLRTIAARRVSTAPCMAVLGTVLLRHW